MYALDLPVSTCNELATCMITYISLTGTSTMKGRQACLNSNRGKAQGHDLLLVKPIPRNAGD